MGKDMSNGEWKDYPDGTGPRPQFKLDGQVPKKRLRTTEFNLGEAIKQRVYDHEFNGMFGLDGQDYV